MKKTLIPVLLCLMLTTNAQISERGAYFAKKKYMHEQLPEYKKIKNQLPTPILDDNKDWIELYWKAWQLGFSNLKTPPTGSPLVSNWIDEGFWPQIFQWDTNFMTMFGRYANNIFPFINSQDNFYAAQHLNGMICRVINEADGADHEWGLGPNFTRTINPPLFAWAEVENYKFTVDKARLSLVLPVLEKYAEWIDKNRTDKTTPHRLYWTNGQASGMDNTARDTGRPNDGDVHSANDPMGWVDMSSQMVIFYNNLSFIAKELNDTIKAARYNKQAADIAIRINKFMWNEKTGLYHDVTPEGKQTTWKTVAAFWPLLAGITSTQQTDRLVKNIKDTTLFWRTLPLPSLAADQPTYDVNGHYWLGGVWAPTSYMVAKGLEQHGYNNLASTIAGKFLYSMSEIYKATGTIWEVYSPEMYLPATDASGKYICKPNFVGWNGLVPISLLIENIIGIEANAIDNSITWHLQRQDRNGIENLRFGKIITSLVCETLRTGEERKITVTSNLPYKLIVNEKVFSVKTGDNLFLINNKN